MIRESRPVIQITAEVRESLRSAADTGLRNTDRRVETGGILTAPLNDDAGLVVDGIEIIPCAHQYGPAYHLSPDELDRMRAQAERIRAAGSRKIVGYFHTSLGSRFNLFPDDEVVVREILPESQFILLVKPLPAGLSMARLFERNAAGRWDESAHFEMLPRDSVAIQPPVSQPLALAVSPPRAGSAPAGRKLSWVRFAGGLIVVALLLLAWYQSRQRPASTSSVATLGMRVNPQGNSFWIGWDRNSPALKLASDGILRILDGGRRREITLDSTQIQTGSILYRPTSDDVTFSLEILRNGAMIANESVRALDVLRSGAPVEVAAGGAQAPPASFGVRSPHPRAAVPDATVAQEQRASRTTQFEAARPETTLAPAPIPPAQSAATVPPSPQPSPTANSAKPPATPDPVPNKPAPAEPKAVAAAAPLPPVTREEPPPTVTPAVSGPIVTAAKPVRKFMPNTRNLGPTPLYGTAEIEVQVSIDTKGRVTEAHALTSGKKINQVLLGEALEAAKKWTFDPATDRGQAVPSTHLITFRFVPGS